MNYISFVLIGVIVLLLLGFLIGFLRNWKKSLTRFIILLVCVLFSLFMSPVITNALLGNSVNGTTISIFSFEIDIGAILSNMINNPEISSDLMGANATTNRLISALVRVVANIAVFLVLFLVLYLLTLLIYAIVFAVLSSKRKKKGITVEKNGKYWGLKVLSGFIGMLGMMFIAFVFMVPAFGVLKVCSYLETSKDDNTTSAYSVQSFMGDTYEPEQNSNPMNTYIDKAVEIKNMYDGSFLGKSLNFFGISKLGESAFDYLTNVTVTNSSGSLRFELCNELSSIIAVYNIYNEDISGGKFDIADNTDIDTVKTMYDNAVKSEVLKSYLTELLPRLCERWENGQKFLGISAPGGDYQDIVIDTISVFNTNNIDEISSNIKALLDAIKVVNNYKLIQTLNDNGDIMEFFLKTAKDANNEDYYVNENFIHDFIMKLVATDRLKVATPDILTDFIGIAYKTIFPDDQDGLSVNKQVTHNIADWDAEAKRIQAILNGLFRVNDKLSHQDGTSTISFMDELVQFGDILDNAKNSIILSSPLHQFMYNFLSSDKIDLNETVREQVLDAFGTLETPSPNWTDPNFSFKKLFNAIYQTYETAMNLQDKLTGGSLEDIKDVIGDVLTDGSIKDTMKDLLSSGIVDEFVGSDDSGLAGTVTDILDSVLSQATEGKTEEEIRDALDKDFQAGQDILDVFTRDQATDGNLFGNEEGQKSASDFVDSLQQSDAVWGLLEKEVEKFDNDDSDTNTAIKDAIDKGLTPDDKQALKDSLAKSDKLNGNDELIEKFNKFFGLDNLSPTD